MHLKYSIREPKNITYNTNILVLIHGYGSNKEDLFSFSADLPKDWLVISLQAPNKTPYGGFCWYDIDFTNKEKIINVEQAEFSLSLIIADITEVRKKYNITDSYTHLCGFSQGGVLSYALALRKPDLFQKVACLSTYPENKILQNIASKEELQHLRFFISHGTEDIIIPIEWAKKGYNLLYDLNVFFSFREYLAEHNINYKNYQDMINFFQN